MANKDQQLKVDLTGGLLTISIGVSEICGQLRRLSALEGLVVVDEDAFTRSLVAHLEGADDRGITVVHHLLDEAATVAIVAGAEGVRLDRED